MRSRVDYVIVFVLFVLTGLTSCWGWEESQEETKKAISTLEKEETTYVPQKEQRPEGYEELKDVMVSASKHMKRLDVALSDSYIGDKGVNWTTTRDSAKSLEDLIGKRCVNSYIKVYKNVPQEFVQISQKFNDAVLRLLMAGHYRDASLAKSQFQLMQEHCEECHQKYRKEIR